MAGAATKATAMWVIRRLRRAGFEALLAGGCVRDLLLGARPVDYDVATGATPAQVRRLFHRVLLVGAQFGVAMVIHEGRRVEVATFRTDVSYSDGRRPDHVRFSNPKEDALRRDFTVNGMFYDPVDQRVIDYVGGRQDLRRKVIRTIGEPGLRFGEDYLRMLRAVRFAVRLGFVIEPASATAIGQLADRVTRISGERIFDELSKMLATARASEALSLLERHGLARAILPELWTGAGQPWAQGCRRVDLVAGRQDPTLALGALLGGLERRQIEAVTRRWGCSNPLRHALVFLAGNLNRYGEAPSMELADFKTLAADGRFGLLVQLWRAQERIDTGSGRAVRAILRRARAIPANRLSPGPLVSGRHLKALGLSEGPLLGRLYREIHRAQLNEQVRTHKEAMDLARRLVEEAMNQR